MKVYHIVAGNAHYLRTWIMCNIRKVLLSEEHLVEALELLISTNRVLG